MAARSQRRAPLLPFLGHRWLLTAEVLLAVDLSVSLCERLLMATSWPWWCKPPVLMLITVGAFGGLLLALQRSAKRLLERAHAVIQALPLPTPYLLVHLLFWALAFWGYAWSLGVLP